MEVGWFGSELNQVASMGPQLYRCGNTANRDSVVGDSWASMGPQLYRCGNIPHRHPGRPVRVASMGPQLYRCGNAMRGRGSHASRCSFNGAATLSLRKFVIAVLPYHRDQASMGPQLYRCGNLRIWGRAIMGDHASMGPQLYRCGNFAVISSRLSHRLGFNGAATLSLRKSTGQRTLRRRNRCFNGAATLSLRKSSSLVVGISSFILLQWGRNFIVAEIRRASWRPCSALSCFNGAATLSLRK